MASRRIDAWPRTPSSSAHGAVLHARPDARLSARAVVRTVTATASSRARFMRQFAPLDDGTRLIVAPEALSRFYLDPIRERRSERVAARRRDVDDARGPRVGDRGLRRVPRARGGRGPPPLAGAAPRIVVLGFSQGTATVCRWLAASALRADQLVLWAADDSAGAGPRRVGRATARRGDHARGGRAGRDGAAGDDGSPKPSGSRRRAWRSRSMRYDGGHEITEAGLKLHCSAEKR